MVGDTRLHQMLRVFQPLVKLAVAILPLPKLLPLKMVTVKVFRNVGKPSMLEPT
jgi:hypothetical protein